MDGTQVRVDFIDPGPNSSGMFRAGSRDALIADALAEADAGAGVIALRGRPGFGKTALMIHLAQALRAPGRCIVTIGAFRATPLEMQRIVADAAGLDRADSLDPDRLLRALRATGGYDSLVILLDDADKVSSATFRYLTLLRDLCPFTAIRLQLVLFGAMGPWRGLEHPDTEALRREAVSHLFVPPLTDDEAAAYLGHRLALAGMEQASGMTRGAMRDVLRRAAGSPSEIGRLTTLALNVRSSTGRRRITARALRRVLPPQPVEEREPGRRTSWALAGGAAVLVLAAITSVVLMLPGNQAAAPPLTAPVASPAAATATDPDRRQDTAASPSAEPPADLASLPHSTLPQPPPSQVARGLTISPEAARSSATAPAPNAAGGPGLVLMAGKGDTMPSLYARVYRGVAPPPYAVVVAANRLPIKEGSLVMFPTPPHGWAVRGPSN